MVNEESLLDNVVKLKGLQLSILLLLRLQLRFCFPKMYFRKTILYRYHGMAVIIYLKKYKECKHGFTWIKYFFML